MQDILSFVQATSPKTLAPSTPNTINNQSSDGSFSESFFSIILGQFAKESVQAPLITELNQELPTAPTLELNTADQEAKSVDEHLLNDLLSVVNALQQNSQTTVFPTLNPSSTLEKILGSETARQDFANVKNVSDLMDLSKKYNLGLEKLSISQESLASLQTKFPKLTQNNFFDDLQTALNTAQSTQNSEMPKAETTNIMSLLGKEPKKAETTPVSSILSTLINTPSEQNTAVDDALPLNTPVIQEPLKVNEKQPNVLAQALQTPQEESVQAATLPHEIATQKTAVKNNEVKNVTPTTTDTPIQEEAMQIASSRINDVKKEPLVKTEEETLDALLKPLKLDKNSSDSEEIVPVQKIVKNEENETTQTSSEESQPITDVKNEIKTTKQEPSVKNTPIKESLNQFASDLKEKIEAYKPPIMKVELSLSPKNLGEVDVTLLTRGNNLHVNISSNTSTMSLFTQNQNDVKNALINMGFTNLEMNFSDQNTKEQAQQNSQKQNNGNVEEFNEEETALLEIVIPQYV